MIRIDTDSYRMLGQNTDSHPQNVADVKTVNFRSYLVLLFVKEGMTDLF